MIKAHARTFICTLQVNVRFLFNFFFNLLTQNNDLVRSISLNRESTKQDWNVPLFFLIIANVIVKIKPRMKFYLIIKKCFLVFLVLKTKVSFSFLK